MSDEAEKIKLLIEFKKRVEKKVEDLELELKELQATLETVNSILLDKGFKRAEIPKTPAAPTAETSPQKEPVQPIPEAKEVSLLKTAIGELLATLYIGQDSLRIVLAEDKNFNVNTPPFTQFLIERVLMKMQEKDSELANSGQLAPEQVFSFEIVKDGENVREMLIKNVDGERLKELKSSIRWTLEKMYEKMKNPS